MSDVDTAVETMDLAIGQIYELRSEIQRLRDALTEARRFMDYFANGHREFVGPGTPLSCLAHIDWALKSNAAPEAPESRPCDGARGGTKENR